MWPKHGIKKLASCLATKYYHSPEICHYSVNEGDIMQLRISLLPQPGKGERALDISMIISFLCNLKIWVKHKYGGYPDFMDQDSD